MELDRIEYERQMPSKRGMEVFCRFKGSSLSDNSHCLTIISDSEIQVCRQDTSQSQRYKFKRVFGGNASQKCVFDSVGFPLVQDLLAGRSGLLFAYGVTGSGKTFTMTGTKEEPGIMPRCLDAIFNSIAQFQADKCIFKPDKLNGFEIQSEADARLEREHAFLKHVSQRKNAAAVLNLQKKESEDDLLGRSRDSSRVAWLNEDNSFAVFITYVEIYNNNVYDLLEDMYNDISKPRPLQSKIIREDQYHNMYVHGVTEVEISSPEEAFEIFYIGQKRKHVAQTTLNRESSRAHTIFSIRVVQAPLDEGGENVIPDKNLISVSQLCLVDLAGSERSLRTQNTGQRLREAGNINNSLMTLRICLEILRDNQNGGNKMIPYRESRLTHLFKNYFDGEGRVSMIICVSPSNNDLDETVHVLKFAEMSQEIQISHIPARIKSVYTPGRRKANQVFIEALKDQNAIVVDCPTDDEACSSNEQAKLNDKPVVKNLVDRKPLNMFTDIVNVGFVEPQDESMFASAIKFWENKLENWSNLTNNINKKYLDLREIISKNDRDKFVVTQEVKTIKSLYDVEKSKTAELEKKTQEMNTGLNELKRKLHDSDFREKKLKRQLMDTKIELDRVKLEHNHTKDLMKSKIRDTEEKLNKELERKLHSQKNTIYELKKKDRKLKEVRRIIGEISSDGSRTPSMASLQLQIPSENADLPGNAPPISSEPLTIAPSTPQNNSVEPVTFRSTGRKLGIPVSNRRHRRSRSADVWLDHRPAIAVPLTTVMQPKMEKRKSITKLTQAKDVTSKTSKYCLMTQAQDSDGDIETRLYKADVIPTSGGGAQVMFNDVEVLKQMSPTKSPCKQ